MDGDDIALGIRVHWLELSLSHSLARQMYQRCVSMGLKSSTKMFRIVQLVEILQTPLCGLNKVGVSRIHS